MVKLFLRNIFTFLLISSSLMAVDLLAVEDSAFIKVGDKIYLSSQLRYLQSAFKLQKCEKNNLNYLDVFQNFFANNSEKNSTNIHWDQISDKEIMGSNVFALFLKVVQFLQSPANPKKKILVFDDSLLINTSCKKLFSQLSSQDSSKAILQWFAQLDQLSEFVQLKLKEEEKEGKNKEVKEKNNVISLNTFLDAIDKQIKHEFLTTSN